MPHTIPGKHPRQLYHAAQFKASYYSWLARKRSPAAGNDPLTGRPRSIHNHHDREAGKAAHKALCRYWLGVAARIRDTHHTDRASA